MKRTFFLLLILLPFVTNTTFGRSLKMKYTIDTFRVYHEAVATQRSSEQEMNKYISKGGQDYRVAMGVSKLQEQLDRIQSYIKNHQGIRESIALSENLVAQIKEADAEFDLSRYENELAFYKKYASGKVQIDASDDERMNAVINIKAPTMLLIDSAMNVDQFHSFNDMIIGYTNDYKLISKSEDSGVNAEPQYKYSNAEDDILNIIYETKMAGENKDLKWQGYLAVRRHNINGPLLALLPIYNGLFGKSITITEAQRQRNFKGYFYYHGHKYNYTFGDLQTKDRQWQIFIY